MAEAYERQFLLHSENESSHEGKAREIQVPHRYKNAESPHESPVRPSPSALSKSQRRRKRKRERASSLEFSSNDEDNNIEKALNISHSSVLSPYSSASSPRTPQRLLSSPSPLASPVTPISRSSPR